MSTYEYYCSFCERGFTEDQLGGRDGLRRIDGAWTCPACVCEQEDAKERRGIEIDAILSFIPSLSR
jgi:hypothetical protein